MAIAADMVLCFHNQNRMVQFCVTNDGLGGRTLPLSVGYGVASEACTSPSAGGSGSSIQISSIILLNSS